MKGLKKLALVTAIAAAPMSGFAMEAMEDEALAAVTGQDGVTITLGAMTIGGVRIDDADADGLVNLTGANGAIFISGISMSGTTTVVVDADADTIQAAITLGAGTINLGAISPTAYQSNIAGTNVITMGTLNHGAITMNVQLGAEDQGSMIALSGTVTGGINLTGFSIADGGGAVTGGSITMNLGVTSVGVADLNLAGTIDVDAAGLQINNLGAVDVTLGALTLGDATAAAIGDVSILNLQPGSITIAGH